MSEHAWQFVLLAAGAVVAGVVQALFRSKNEQGKRIGRLEKYVDFERGRQAGLRERTRGRGQ